jgi:hypothetical protein
MMIGFTGLALLMAYNAGLGAYHAGIEWKFWPGPAECSGTGADFKASGSLLSQLQHGISVVRCDQAAWRLFGISLPGWNVLVSGRWRRLPRGAAEASMCAAGSKNHNDHEGVGARTSGVALPCGRLGSRAVSNSTLPMLLYGGAM